MLDYEALFELEPFGLEQKEKENLYNHWLAELSRHHCLSCESYQRIVNVLGDNPALPVRLFKDFDLMSIDASDIVKTMTSSGTTGQRVSKIYLDRSTSARQTKALAKIVSSFTGSKRMPMLIVDSSAVVKNRAMFSARGAGILGFSVFGRDVTYALDENMNLDIEAIKSFQERHRDESVLLFGFTFMIWQYFCQALLEKGIMLDMRGIMIHGGGWKKLVTESVTNEEFKRIVAETSGIQQIHNYYGMVEQTGSVFMECEEGHLHASVFSDVFTLDPLTLQQTEGRGVVGCVSLLPTSYPGHILLTEDEGEVLGVDDCPCGRKGRYFSIYGRMRGAEIRGCSDTHEKR
ncbi:LuxE/PaaK family acyltransferase [Raoultibacter phocaeensis]|uniref:LuxE/PaaK family acyltransferase n=1 Tax=Raoultibacter phocaeensis TaxID=2479841 RepID=UPI001117BD73|nr:acyl-protein synthetase [Raoultibacter phocaeensis]